MTKRFTIALALALLATVRAHSQSVTFTRVLLPIFTADTPGAYGSVWQVRTWLRYSGSESALIVPEPFCFGVPCPLGLDMQPGWGSLPFYHRAGFPEPALLVHIDSRYASQFTFNSRVRDLSRNGDSAGTQVPVVREDEMFDAPLYLLDIPVGPRFRNMLRLYALPDVADPEVEVRYYRQTDPDRSRFDARVRLLRSELVRLRTRAASGPYQFYPALAEIGNIDTLPELAAAENIWIEVVPLTPGLRFWAMVSVTNNSTQEVTIVSPDR